MTQHTKRESRVMVQVRIGRAGLDRIDALAAEAGTNRSELIRTAVAVALAEPSKITAAIERKRQQL